MIACNSASAAVLLWLSLSRTVTVLIPARLVDSTVTDTNCRPALCASFSRRRRRLALRRLQVFDQADVGAGPAHVGLERPAEVVHD